jgi:hypothetical protein
VFRKKSLLKTAFQKKPPALAGGVVTQSAHDRATFSLPAPVHRQNSEFLQTLDFHLHSRIQWTSSKLYLHRSDRLLGDHDNDAFIANFDRQ